ncbi:MAG: hypothetical protein Q9227_007836 [Pyrenula ochraceoflavens]
MTETKSAHHAQSPDPEEEKPLEEKSDNPSSEEDQNTPKGSSKKRKRNSKVNPEKKFDCKHEGCGKSYSRAEHLYRHQLNHSPKQIYRCDYPDCPRTFVRQDLCIRHRERHTTHGSQIHKRDTFAQANHNQSPLAAAPARHDSTSTIASVSSPVDQLQSPDCMVRPQYGRSPIAAKRGSNDMMAAQDPASFASRVSAPSVGNSFDPQDRFAHRSDSTSSYTLSPTQKTPVTAFYGQANYANADGHQFQAPGSRPNASISMPYQGQTTTASSFVAAVSNGLNDMDPSATYPAVAPLGVEIHPFYSWPMFGGDEYNRSPNAIGDDFANWLFNEQQMQPDPRTTFPASLPAYSDASTIHFQGPYYADDEKYSSYPAVVSTQHPMSVMSLLDSSRHNMSLSEEKRQELLDLMQDQFNERPHDAVKRRKEAIFGGDMNVDSHILSLRQMELYIGSYWHHQHAQLPILHRPTFYADKTPNLLLLAVIMIGAATLDKLHGSDLTDFAAEFANFVAWHLRWEILRDADFRPPAKLWVFQTLLLLEVYEKMYATRALHERAHIHHDTTLTLMRRGSSLIGRSAFDSPPSVRDTQTGRSSGSNSATDLSTNEDSWNQWIRNEATRRAAFAAFVLDSTHATMFGHSAKMVAHEMRLPLPCDEALWSAASAAEVARIQSTLQIHGIKPTMFLDALKRTLDGAKVRTNPFGRTIIMAGLLSVSWHMNQRDLQISSLGPSIGGRDKWRKSLLLAFDYWKRDFDEALAEAQPPAPIFDAFGNPTSTQPRQAALRAVDDENIFESRTVLHHLAHMASHVDIVDCQIYAGASRLLGRSITPKDYSKVSDRITTRWATRASARDAAFYALKFLKEVMIPPEERSPSGHHGYAVDGAILGHAFLQKTYWARDDFLLNRPWVLYFAALVVWCYGFALEGPISNSISITGQDGPPPQDLELLTGQERDADMRAYLDRVGGVRAPDDLEAVKGKNRCLGLLLILRESFEKTRWELTREASNLLGSCIGKLRGQGIVGRVSGSVGDSGGGTPVVGNAAWGAGGVVRGTSVISV